MVTVITNANRKLMRKIINERIDELQVNRARLQNTLTNLDKQNYNQTNQETVNNMNADEYETNLNTQIGSLTDRIQKLKDGVDWLNEQVLS